jgi:hypothetical protein
MSDLDDSELTGAAKALGRLGGLKGGKARAEKLSAAQRSEIAKKAVEARWARVRGEIPLGQIPKATHAGTLKIGDVELSCAVLEDGTRVLTQEGFLHAIGRAKKAKGGEGASVDGLPAFLRAANLKPFISKELEESTRPVVFRPAKGPGYRGIAYGYRAELLPEVCKVYLQARDAKALTPRQQNVATQCDILIRGLATVGIVALVDEATGYQYDRPRKAMLEILETFISKELLKWAKMFPDEFYRELFRLRGWQFTPGSSRRPVHAAKLTIDLVYKRLAPGVLGELQRLIPKDEKGRRKHKFFQRLTEDVGHPKLREHLTAVIGFMRAFDDWDEFYARLNRAFPRYPENLQLFFRFSEDDDDERVIDVTPPAT